MSALSASHQIAIRHFGRKVVNALASKGIRLVGLQAIPSPHCDFADPDTGYLMDDNGCGRVWTYTQVQQAAR
jgi:hypothetical protein